jgi:hypothetical protein
MKLSITKLTSKQLLHNESIIMPFQRTISPLLFKAWLLQDKENKLLFVIALILMTLSFGWLKYTYPYPNFMPPDSYNYLESATNNDLINLWPIGYPKFLRLVSVFTRSHLILVIFQYILLQTAVLYFLFSVRYFVSPDKWLFRIILSISVANPLLSHIANFISSDSLFASLSLVWFTQLLWILYKPTKTILLTHAFVLLLAFTVRFTAVYYPLVSITIIYFAHMPTKRMWVGISSIVALLLIFIGRTQYEYKVRTGTIQYTAFGGWQIAANALYGYAYADTIPTNQVPEPFQELHRMVNRHMDSIRLLAQRPDAEPGVYYMWDFKSPLLLYFFKHKDKKLKYFEQWAQLAPVYRNYGRWLIKQHPLSFIKHYVWPNLLRYYAPPAYFMGMYNTGKTTTDQIAVTWFNWKSNQLPTRFNNREIHIMILFPHLLAILNPSFLVIVLFLATFIGIKQFSPINKQILGCLMLVWFANTFFSVLAAPIELRYQTFPVVITLTFFLLIFSSVTESFKTTQPVIQTQTTEYK